MCLYVSMWLCAYLYRREWQCVAVCCTMLQCVALCCSVLWCERRTAAVGGSSDGRTAAVAMRRSPRSGCVIISRHVELLVQCRRAASLRRCAGGVVCVSTSVTRGCVSALRLGCQEWSCRRNAYVSRGTHSLFAVAVLLCRALVCTCMSSHHSRRVVTCATVSVSLGCRAGRWRQVPAGCLVVSFGSQSHTVLRLSDSLPCADWTSFHSN
jgi:hypothetical protein